MIKYLSIRITTPHSNIQSITNFLDHPHIYYYVYCFETGKNNQEHWHLQLKTDLHPDTVTKRIRAHFPTLSKTDRTCKVTRETIPRAIAYLFKEQNYTIHWDNNDEIEEAHKIYNNFQEEVKLPTLKLKCLAYLKTVDPFYIPFNTALTCEILKWFKEKELTYPSQMWLKNCMITYWMDTHKETYDGQNQDNIMKIYNIHDPFIKDQTPTKKVKINYQ